LPELPEVETVRRGLTNKLGNFEIKDLKVYRERAIASHGGSSIFIEKLIGTQIGEWSRRGKYLLSNLYKNHPSKKDKPINCGWLVVHLRMTGYFLWNQSFKEPCPYTRVSFFSKEGVELRFVDIRSFGQLWWVPPYSKPEKEINGIKRLGPEPFSNDFNPSYFKECLKGRSRSIKSSLLDQSIVAGTGNIYADESLFESGILPYKPSKELTNKEIKVLCLNLEKVLLKSIKNGGTTFSDFRDIQGLNGNYGEQAWVYRRTDKPCRKCGEKIKRQVICGRGTHWCPKCQN